MPAPSARIELEINENWTSFLSYRHPVAQEPTNLLPEMFHSPERYLVPDERTFFAVYLKPGRSGEATAPRLLRRRETPMAARRCQIGIPAPLVVAGYLVEDVLRAARGRRPRG